MITGGMDGMLKQASRKPIKAHKNPKPNQEILLYMVRSHTINVHAVLPGSCQSGLQHLENFPFTLRWLQSHILAQQHWAFCPYPVQGPAEAVSCLQSLSSWYFFCFLDNMNDPLIIIWTKAIRNWDWGIEVQYLARKLRKTEIWAGELRLSGKYCSSWVQKLLRLAGIFLFLNSKERAFACSCIYITVWRSQHGELIKKTSQNNHKIFQLLFNHEPFHLVEKWWNCLTRTPLQHIIQFVNY